VQNPEPVNVGKPAPLGPYLGRYVKPKPQRVVSIALHATDEPDDAFMVGFTVHPLPPRREVQTVLPHVFPEIARITGLIYGEEPEHVVRAGAFVAKDEPDLASMIAEVSSFTVQLDNEFLLTVGAD
jgi:hypothetical protein